MSNPVGPRAEQASPQHQAPPDKFAAVIGALAEAAAQLPEPFDVVTSAALGDNDRAGDAAVALFDAMRKQTAVRYRIQVHQVADGVDGPVERELVNTIQPGDVAAALLADMAQYLEENDRG